MSSPIEPNYITTNVPNDTAASPALKNADDLQFRLMVESAMGHAIFMTNLQGIAISWNPGVERILGFREDEWVGQDISFIFTPEDRANGVPEREMQTATREGRAEDVRWHLRKDGTRFFADGVLNPVFDDSGAQIGFAKVLRDATKRHEIEQALQLSEEFLRRVIESSPDCIKTLDLNGNLVSMTDGGQEMMEVDDFDLICGVNWLTFWDDETAPAVRAALDAAREGGAGRFQGFCPTMKGAPKWWDVVVSPIFGPDGKPEQLLGVSRDITEARLASDMERARFNSLFMQAPAFMAALYGPNHVFELANPPYYQLVGHREILGKPLAEALPEVVEQGFIDLLDTVYRTGEPFIGKDMAVMLQRTPDAQLEECFVDFSYQPLREADGTISGVLAYGVDLTARKRLEQERERLLALEQARAEQQALLNRIGAAIRVTDAPEEVYATAVDLLGKALKADRCYFNTYDPAGNIFQISRDYYRPGLSSMAGEYSMDELSDVYRELYPTGHSTIVYNDLETADLSETTKTVMTGYGMRSYLGVTLSNEYGSKIASLRVTMTDKPRTWTADEISLVESVATLVRVAMETARVRQRERNIAQQLQAALQPPIPSVLPGLTLECYYQPALEEAGVGGDFYDVYELENNCTALVVGDLSGKGLAAASQVAAVRNMLRCVLYLPQTTLASAINLLSNMLIEHDLLAGFATLFVGVYDQQNRTLNYVNCGQEPGLLWRAETGEIELLSATGPILGGMKLGGFNEFAIRLDPGDVFTIFTDGLTDSGPTRRALLELAGVSDLFVQSCNASANATNPAEKTPAAILANLMQRVQAYAQSGVWDDVCLLVGMAD